MSQYTMELRELLNNGIDVFRTCDYPIFSEDYRQVLQGKILDHFYFMEIGCETAGRFMWNLRVTMNEIMPSMNKKYLALLEPLNIFYNYDIVESMTKEATNGGTVSSASEQDGTNSTAAKKLFSDTPQGRTSLTGSEFVSTINDDTGSETTASSGTNSQVTADNAAENWTRKMKGNSGMNEPEALLKYMELIISVDEQIYKKLNNLFMLIH